MAENAGIVFAVFSVVTAYRIRADYPPGRGLPSSLVLAVCRAPLIKADIFVLAGLKEKVSADEIIPPIINFNFPRRCDTMTAN